MPRLVVVLVLVAVVLGLWLSPNARAAPPAPTAINAVLGDASWTAGDPALADETARIQAHLRFVLDRLRRAPTAHLARPQRARRAAALAALARYLERAEFPRRTGDGHPGRRPRFIDDRGVHCAVGQLIADSGAPGLARAIADRHEYAYVHDIAEPALLAWAAAHGFTVDELAMIQPAYGGVPTPDGTRREIEDAKDRIMMTCAAEHPPVERLVLRVIGDEHGRAIVATKSTTPFARCFVTHASQLERGGGAWEGSPEPYAFDLTVQLATPQQVFARRFPAGETASSCVPRPGPTPRKATYKLASDRDGLVVAVTTAPRNAEVEACLAEAMRARYRDFAAGAWRVSLERTQALRSELAAHLGSQLDDYAMQVGLACTPDLAARAQVAVRVAAVPDEPQLAIAVTTADAALAACVRDGLAQRLRDAYTVSRRLPDGSSERYFRIDAAVEASARVALPTAAERAARERAWREEMDRRKYEL